jgi:hypothetical protein
MSIENINQIQTVQTDIYGDYGLNGISLYGDEQGKYPKQASELKKDISFLSLGSDEFYNIPINNIRAEAKEVIKKLNIFIDDLDIGVDLYEANATTFSGWNKLDLIDNNGVFNFSQTPCN